MSGNNQNSPDESRISLRRDLRDRRLSLSPEKRNSFDEAINKHLLQLVVSRDAGSIACYRSFNGEPDITPACKHLIRNGCELALPVISETNDFSMEFHPWQSDTSLVRNWYGIDEPHNSTPMSISSFDVLIMPLVGYDLHGNRIGMGAGYYDRHLESLRDAPTPLRVGIAYSLQEVDPIRENSWDIPLHAVVNELGCFTLSDETLNK